MSVLKAMAENRLSLSDSTLKYRFFSPKWNPHLAILIRTGGRKVQTQPEKCLTSHGRAQSQVPLPNDEIPFLQKKDAPNLLGGDFKATGLNQKWVIDITEFRLIGDYGHEFLPGLPSYLPPSAICFTTICHTLYQDNHKALQTKSYKSAGLSFVPQVLSSYLWPKPRRSRIEISPSIIIW